MKHYLKAASIYTLIGLISGVFYREITKILDYTGPSNLSLIHGHYISLGLFVFLFLLILEKQFAFSKIKKTKEAILGYHIGLNITGLGFLMRGLTQVLEMDMTKGLNASISGISGMGHILLAISLLMILRNIKKALAQNIICDAIKTGEPCFYGFIVKYVFFFMTLLNRFNNFNHIESI